MAFGQIIDAAAKRSTPEQRERVKQLRMASGDKPSPEREAARAEIAFSVHAIDTASWQCPTCLSAYAYPHSQCPTCRVPYPRRCTTSGCGCLVTAERGQSPNARCWDCSVSSARQGRAHAYAASSIPPGPRRGAMHLVAYPQQGDALAAVREWVGTRHDALLWRRDKSEPEREFAVRSMLFLGGGCGLGKSTLAAHAIHLAYVERGYVPHFHWHSQAKLAELHRELFAGDDAARARAVSEWRAVVESPLLVIDELFGDRMTPGFSEEMARLIRERLDYQRPTVITANIAPQWQAHFEFDVGRIESRWRQCGRLVQMRGTDLRRAA